MSHRAWTFTVNNYTPEQEEALKAAPCQYLVFGHELAPTTGTPHLQGYIYTTRKVHSYMMKLIPGGFSWIAPSVADAKKNREYATKDQDFFEKGTMPQQGKRNDIDAIRQELRNGSGMREIVDTATSYQSVKMAEIWLKYNEPVRDFLPEVYWYWGPSGSGKTRLAHEREPDLMIVPSLLRSTTRVTI